MRNRGFTLIEMVVYIVLSGAVIGSIYQLLIAQGRSYGKQRELMDVHTSIRATAALLAWEIRQLSAADSDIYAIGANSITLRSVQGSGVVCTRNPILSRIGIYGWPGDMTATDSALFYYPSLGTWRVVEITGLAPASATVCDWGGTPPLLPDTVIIVAVSAPADTAGLTVGGPFRAFRRVEYGIYEDAGRWWLGRKVGGAASYEKLTGPLVAGGLEFVYADANGVVTADRTQVATVEITIRAESFKLPPGRSNYQIDTLSTIVALRG